MSDTQSSAFPLTSDDLQKLASTACEQALGDARQYDHKGAKQWSQLIINKLIESLVTATHTDAEKPAPFKFAVNSTVIQNTIGGGGPEKRGMYSSVGAFWNPDKDGMWNYKYEAGTKLGLDIVLSIIWISV